MSRNLQRFEDGAAEALREGNPDKANFIVSLVPEQEQRAEVLTQVLLRFPPAQRRVLTEMSNRLLAKED